MWGAFQSVGKTKDILILEKFLFEVANPLILSPQTHFEVARLPQKWEYPTGEKKHHIPYIYTS